MEIFTSTIFDIFSLTHKEEEVWPDGTHHMLFVSQIVSAYQRFRPVALFFFLEKVPFLAFFLIQKGVWPYKYAYDVPLVTLILNIYGFVGLAPFFLWKKYHFWLLFNTKRGVAI